MNIQNLPPIPLGFCQCGCGQTTSVAKRTAKRWGYVKGQPRRFRKGHYGRPLPQPRKSMPLGKRYGEFHPGWKGGVFIEGDGYRVRLVPGHPRAHKGRYVPEHILIAEKALGKPLPQGAIVHHFNEVRSDNSRGNLVICQNDSYHQLLHLRRRALLASGNPNFRKCPYCKQWDDPQKMYIHQRARAAGRLDLFCHLRCKTEHNKRHAHLRKEKALAE